MPPVLGSPQSSSKRKDELGDRQRKKKKKKKKKKKTRHSMHTTFQPFEAEGKSAFDAWSNTFKEGSVVTTNDERDHGNGQ
jgi:phage-related minor tail protein